MAKHLTVLVHGIGEQVAGETVDEFVGAARHELGLGAALVDNTVHLSERDETLPEAARDKEQLHQYPCHIRRLTTGNSELVFAEVHWSDLSKAPTGVFATAFDLLRLVLGMGYLALDNIESNGGSGWGLLRLLIHLFVWIFFLILAPINALVFFGAVGLLLDTAGIGFGYGQDQWSPLYLLGFMGTFLTLVAGWGVWSADTYLKRLFLYGLFGLGILCLLVAIGGQQTVHWPINTNWIPTCDVRQSFVVGVPPGVNCFTGVLIFCMNSVWLFEVGLFLVITIFSFFSWEVSLFNKQSIYLSVCAGMLLFWMTFSVSFWAVFRTTVAQLGGPDRTILLTRVMNEHFAEATATLPYVVFAVILVLIVAALVWGCRIIGKLWFKLALDEDGKKKYKFSRLILNPFLNLAFVAASMLLVMGAFYAFAQWWLVDGRTERWLILIPANQFVWIFGRFADDLVAWSGAALTIVAGIGVLIVRNSGFVAAALGVGRDIVVYATRSHCDGPLKKVSRMRKLRERIFGKLARPSRYMFRERIEARFEETMTRLIEQEGKIDQLTVVSHSQGTVAAVMGLLKLQKAGGRSFSNVEKRLNLVTMGCPLQHVYRRYFSDNYEVDQADWHSKKRWLNIYRVDDFVGKTVGGHGLDVDDQPVLAAKGHSHYWSDKLVWQILRDKKIY
jgi:hypothetical protein